MLAVTRFNEILIMAMTANKVFWTEFIDIYRSLPSLWNTKDENYNSRDNRYLCWNKLVEKLQEVEPDANQDSVKRKINTFRSNFNREVRKMRLAQKEQPIEEYTPTLWYFDHLSFLLKHVKYNNNISTDDEEITLMDLKDTKSEIVEENDVMYSESITQELMIDNDDVIKNNSPDRLADLDQIPLNLENANKSIEAEKTTAIAGTRTLSNPKRSKLHLKSQYPYGGHQFRKKVLSKPTDEAAIYGQAWACGFRKLNPQQKFFAKKAIDEILVLGQLKALKLNTVQMNANLYEESGDQS